MSAIDWALGIFDKIISLAKSSECHYAIAADDRESWTCTIKKQTHANNHFRSDKIPFFFSSYFQSNFRIDAINLHPELVYIYVSVRHTRTIFDYIFSFGSFSVTVICKASLINILSLLPTLVVTICWIL